MIDSSSRRIISMGRSDRPTNHRAAANDARAMRSVPITPQYQRAEPNSQKLGDATPATMAEHPSSSLHRSAANDQSREPICWRSKET